MSDAGMAQEVEVLERTLGQSSSCDRCGAQARCLVVLNRGVLTLCEHHRARHAQALLAAGARLLGSDEYTIDQRAA